MKDHPGLLFLNTLLAGGMAIFFAGCDKPQVAAGTSPSPATTVGQVIDDGVVTARVKAALFDDPEVKSVDFNIETRKGVVQLSGFADNQAQIDHAVAITRMVTGVKNIENNVNLKGAPTTVGTTVDDGIVTARVKAALFAEASVKGSDIAVVTRRGEVQLSGFVDNLNQIDRALEVARGVEGARSVSNEMNVKK